MAEYLIETKRLQLRPLYSSDLDNLFKIFGDPETMNFYPSTKSIEETEQWINRSQNLYETEKIGFFALEHKENRKFIGECGLIPQKIESCDEMELGYHINKSYWRMGYASEAAVACRDYAFKVLGLKSIISLVRPENIPSARVAEKTGMKEIKRLTLWNNLHAVYSVSKKQL